MKKLVMAGLIVGLMALAISPAGATPLSNASLSVSATMPLSNSAYNPRSFDGKNYVLNISTPANVYRYASGVDSSHEALYTSTAVESRMAAPFRGTNSQQYVLLAGGASNTNFTRLDYTGLTNAVTSSVGFGAGSFDWVNDSTIIMTNYTTSADRRKLYLATVSNDPSFAVTLTGDIWTDSTVSSGQIRNIRVGETYSSYAYFGYGSVNSSGIYAVKLDGPDKGTISQLETLSGITGSGSWGLWTVKEVGGYLYVHTTDNGIYVYNMTDATTLGSLYTQYTKAELDTLAGVSLQNYGFDVVDGGSRMLLGVGGTKVIEIVPEPVTVIFLALGGLLGLRRKH